MDLVADVHAVGVERVQDRLPTPGQLVERGLDQARRPRRPGVEVGPGERAGEGDVGAEAEPFRGDGRVTHLIDRPCLARLGVAAHLGRRKRVEALVIGRMHGDQLALEMGRQLRQLDAGVLENALDLVAIGVALGSLGEVEQATVPARDLHAPVAVVGGPAGNAGKRIERCCVTGELRQEDRRPLDGFHACLPC
jgi:hypothetical protein